MQEEKKQRNRMYQIFELKDSIIDAINNLEHVIKQDNLLIDSVVNGKYPTELKELSIGLAKDIKNYTNRINKYKERLDLCNDLLEMYKKQDETSKLVVKVVTMLIEALDIGVDEKTSND